jgi:hypothetical protein
MKINGAFLAQETRKGVGQFEMHTGWNLSGSIDILIHLKKSCHPDRSEAQWKDLLFLLSVAAADS